MKRVYAVVRNAAAVTAVFSVTLGSHAVLAQDSAFLACARHADRGQRIACLEDALDAALAAQEAQRNPAAAPPPAPVRAPAPEVAEASPVPAQNAVPAAPPATTAPTAPAVTATEPEERTSLLDRIRSFGQDDEASISTDASGNDRLHDTITALEKRNELWTVTLSSGQVWRQVFPRTLNLRVGDEISVYQEGIGNGYRLATPRLSGFIRVERTK
jgi:hypothetical protein